MGIGAVVGRAGVIAPLPATLPFEPAGRTARSSSTSDSLAARVAHLRAEVTALVALDPMVDGVSGPALHAELRTAAGQLYAFAARVLARVEADGRWSASSARTFPDWVARTQLASTGAVRRDVTLGRALDGSLPGTATAVARGEVTLEHAEVLARVAATSPARRAALASHDADRNEAALLERARRMPLDSYRRQVDRWAVQVDAACAESEHEAACAKEHLTLTRRRGGVALQGFLTLENAEVVATALRAVAGVPSQGETRSREERAAAALVDAGRLIVDRGLSGGGQQVRPHLLVHVAADTLHQVEVDDDGTGPARFDGLAPAELDDGTPVPPSTLARLVCDGELTRVVLTADGAVLDVGRARRTYSGQQRLAVIARDRSCRYPGCGAPPMLGEVHHVTSWASGGPTSVANGVLLCWFHHGLVHRRGIRISRIRGGWDFRRDDGTIIGDGFPTVVAGAPPGSGPPAELLGPPGRTAARPTSGTRDQTGARELARAASSTDTARPTTARTRPMTAGTRPVDGPDAIGPPPSVWGGPNRAPERRRRLGAVQLLA